MTTEQEKPKTAPAPAKKRARKTTINAQTKTQVLQDQVDSLIKRNKELNEALEQLREQAREEIKDLSQIILRQAIKLGRSGLV